MEFKCSCYTAERFEKLAKMLVKKEIAEIVEEKILKDDDGQVRERTCKYDLAVGDWGETMVRVRWWENIPLDRASIQMTNEALDALLESATVMALLIQTGQKISKNGHGLNLKDLEKALIALSKDLDIKEGDIEVIP
jgi:hypothetical protein